MAKNRYILCLLASFAMLYYALPRLPVYEEGLAGVFGIAWIALCLFVIAGNLTALLFAPKRQAYRERPTLKQARKRVRSTYNS